MRLEPRVCAWCKNQFMPIRIDQRFHSRECLDRWFSHEKHQAVALLRQMQSNQKFFGISTTLDGDDEMQQRRA
jgi:hypothetical protein